MDWIDVQLLVQVARRAWSQHGGRPFYTSDYCSPEKKEKSGRGKCARATGTGPASERTNLVMG